MFTFTDDFSRKTCIYFLIENFEALVIFKNFKTRVEKEITFSFKGLHTYYGGEFTVDKRRRWTSYLNKEF